MDRPLPASLSSGFPSPGAAVEDHVRRSRARAKELCRRMAGLAEAPMRVQAIIRALRSVPPGDAVQLLDTLVVGAVLHDPPSLAVFDALVDPAPVAEVLGPECLKEFLILAVEAQGVGAIHWLRGVVHPVAAQRELDPDRMVAFGLREMTLGDRRALARRAMGDTLNQLAQDPDGTVITNLLNNPRCTEGTVLSICSRRPTCVPPLMAVLAAQRWASRYPVRLALVRNPYLPLKIGMNLIVYCRDRDLESVRQDASLGSMLRLAAQRLMDIRRGTPTEVA